MAEIGKNVWWSLEGKPVDTEIVQDVLDRNGFSKAYISSPSDEKAFRRAMLSFQGGRKGRMARKVSQRVNQIVYAVVNEKKLSSETLGYDQTTTAYFDKSNGSIRVEGELREEVVQEYNYQRNVCNQDDIRAFITQILVELRAISKRPNGGIYFVFSDKASKLYRLQQFIADLDNKSELFIEGISDGTENKMNVYKSSISTIKESIKEILENVGKIAKRAGCLNRQEDKVEQLKKMSEAYSQMLGEEAKYDDVIVELNDASQVIAKKMITLKNDIKEKRVRKKITDTSESTASKHTKLTGAIVKVLQEAGHPMSYETITQIAVDKGYLDANISHEKNINNCEEMFEVRDGVYSLKSKE